MRSRFVQWSAQVFLGMVLLMSPQAVRADGFGAMVQALPDGSEVRENWRGRTHFDLVLSGAVPWRVHTVAHPDRVVLDFREVDFSSLDLRTFDAADVVTQVTAGPFRAGWSRLVMTLNAPMEVVEAVLDTSTTEGNESEARLRLQLVETTRAAFDANATLPDDALLDQGAEEQHRTVLLPQNFTVVIDPGHGGIDPGAIRKGHEEADLVLALALELEEALNRAGGIQVILTRREDVFVSLERRVALAARAGAHAFVSLHADALAEGLAQGATLYTLAEAASDDASAALAERHNRVDLLAGIDLSQADDEVAKVLLDLARQDTAPRSQMLAKSLVSGLDRHGNRLHKRPLQQAGFSVLKSAEVPSVLVEVAFLSNDEDLARLLDPAWRASVVAGLRDGLLEWAQQDRAVAPFRRQ